MSILNAIFPTKHQRDIKALQPLIKKINHLETEVQQWTEEQFVQRTEEFKKELKEGRTTTNRILPLAFAMVRESAVRKVKMRHYDVQLMGGITLYQGKISEMKTGEGKTLTATLPAYLRALEQKGVHIVTVNDYLSKRDCEWMGPIYQYLGLKVDCIDKYFAGTMERREAYQADITFGTNNEFGFDYLRDNMIDNLEQKVQRPHFFCIVDEVDSVLIDEARTPLIISGPSESNIEKYYQIDKIIPRLREAKADEKGKEISGTGDFVLDIKDRNIIVTEDGSQKIEQLLKIESLYSNQNVDILHHINQALRAHKIMQRDVDYIVENGQVVIVDEFTGRKMEGRRFSDGLHQAIEAKERVNIANENQTLASITFQNYFRMYDYVSGMTGTADTEAEEFKKIYKLEVVVIPTHKPLVRQDYQDKIFRTSKEKYRAIIDKVKECYKMGKPVLIGTISVESSEILSKELIRQGIRHEILNAKNHAREANIIENAGQLRSITIATNMAGRGTDIKLGEGVKEKGGLVILGSERAEARRVDNQLRGRSGRQGDPGESQFYLSLEDELMKRFGSERISKMMLTLGMEEGEEIQHRWISSSIENAQKKVEARNFDIRKHLLEYDDVMNKQRQYIYQERNNILSIEDIHLKINEIIENVVEEHLYHLANNRESVNEELLQKCENWIHSAYQLNDFKQEELKSKKYLEVENYLINFLQNKIKDKFKGHPKEITDIVLRNSVLLYFLDNKWKEHLLAMDHLREGIQLRSYAEKKPLNEFKKEGFTLFENMIDNYRMDVLEKLFSFKIVLNYQQKQSVYQPVKEEHVNSFNTGLKNTPPGPDPSVGIRNQARTQKNFKRNDLCYCGSGKKFKHCHGS